MQVKKRQSAVAGAKAIDTRKFQVASCLVRLVGREGKRLVWLTLIVTGWSAEGGMHGLVRLASLVGDKDRRGFGLSR